jgi:hypothetical protein
MTTVLMPFLLLFTIVVAFILGISLGYWVVCGILYFFSPSRLQNKATQSPSLAHSPSGD